MDEDEVRQALRRVDLDPGVITKIGGGWANWTFDLDGDHIVRFPRSDSVALATHRELLLLPELAHSLSYSVPHPTCVATWRDRPFFAYRRIAGRPLAPGGSDTHMAGEIGRMLGELHRFPVDRAAHLLRLGEPAKVWQQRYEDLWHIISDVALPELDGGLADEVRRHYITFVENPPEFPVCLIHNDLGPVHVLVDEVTARPVGLIDFEDASVGDPAVDLTPLVAALGASALPALVGERNIGPRLADRLWFYRWMGSVHAIIYGVTEDVPAERLAGIKELRNRIIRFP